MWQWRIYIVIFWTPPIIIQFTGKFGLEPPTSGIGSPPCEILDPPPFTVAIAVYVGCIYDPVISVRVLRLLHNNESGYS